MGAFMVRKKNKYSLTFYFWWIKGHNWLGQRSHQFVVTELWLLVEKDWAPKELFFLYPSGTCIGSSILKRTTYQILQYETALVFFTYVSTQAESWLLKVALPASSFSILVLPWTVLGCICMTTLRSPTIFCLIVIFVFSAFLLSTGWWVESLSLIFVYCNVFPRDSILSSILLWRGF